MSNVILAFNTKEVLVLPSKNWINFANTRTKDLGPNKDKGAFDLFTQLIFAMATSRSAFHGPSRKLVMAFDVGTTYSGISYRYTTFNKQTEAKGRHL